MPWGSNNNNNNLLTKNKKRMKKILLFASALAGLFLAGSCQKETLEPAAQGGVTYEITLPDGPQTKGENGYDVYDLHYEVYKTVDAAALETAPLLFEETVTMTGNTTQLTLDLLNDQDYTVLFWANKQGTDYFDLRDLRQVGVKQAASNNDDRDAFCGMDQLAQHDGAQSKTVELKRPFAQINIATLVNAVDYDINPVSSLVKVKDIPVSYNVFTGEPVGAEGEVEYTVNTVPAGNLTVNGTDYKKVAMNYALVPATADNSATVEVYYEINTANGTVKNSIPNVPVKKNYRTNIIGNLLTSNASYTIELKPGFDEDEQSANYVTTTEEIDNALKANEEIISITLGTDVSLTANDAYLALGGPDTKKIIIDGKKVITRSGAEDYYTLNLSTTYWSRLNTVNPDATIVLKNLNLTSSQPTGTWNSYDVTFKCNVEMENVNLLKALALDGVDKTAVLKNVTIAESHDYYALWIAAAGQTVSLENVTINSLGRGIKIDDQYVEEDTKLVTLNVDGLKVKSAKKAAIVVKTPEGAHITLKDVDITEVAADTSNEVWIDEDAASYIDKVTVTGGSMIVEGQETVSIDSMETLKSELAAAGEAGAGYTVLEISSDIDMTGQVWTPIKVDGYNGADIVTIDGKGHTIKGLTSSLFAGGFAGGSGIVIKNLTIENANMIATSTQGYGAFVNCADAMDVITLINCHLKNSTITTPNNGQGESRIGGLVGWTAGYNNQNDGPVDSYITIQGCSVTGCTFTGWGSIGGICGHAGANEATFTTIENCIITNNKFISTDDGGWRTGVVVGTANNGQCVIKNITESGNTLTQKNASDFKNPKGIKRNYVGRFVPSGTGHLTIDGVEVEAGYWPLAEGIRANEKENRYEIISAEGLTSFGKLVNEAGMSFNKETILLTVDVDLKNAVWTPVGQTGATQFKGTFDGQGYTISNLNIDATAQTGANCSSGLFGWLNAATVKNVNIAGATVKGNHNVGVIAGYLETTGCTIEACHVTDAAVECHVANSEANGDKCGVIVGHAGNAGVVVKDCTAANSTVTAGRDAGQIAGAAKEANVTGCSATNVTVTANGEGTGANIRNEVIGRIL